MGIREEGQGKKKFPVKYFLHFLHFRNFQGIEATPRLKNPAPIPTPDSENLHRPMA
jgi:hypothetical protein